MPHVSDARYMLLMLAVQILATHCTKLQVESFRKLSQGDISHSCYSFG